MDSVLAGELPSAQAFGTNVSLVLPMAIDLFLAINLLRGKHWAKTWMLIRVILGLLVWGVIALLQKDFGGLVIQVGYCGALLLLLTGTSTRFRLAGSIACFLLLLGGGMVWTAIASIPSDSFIVFEDNSFWEDEMLGILSVTGIVTNTHNEWSVNVMVMVEAIDDADNVMKTYEVPVTPSAILPGEKGVYSTRLQLPLSCVAANTLVQWEWVPP